MYTLLKLFVVGVNLIATWRNVVAIKNRHGYSIPKQDIGSCFNTLKTYGMDGFSCVSRDLIQSILKVIPVNDPFLKKLKKKNEQLENLFQYYSTLFQPHIQADIPITNFNRANMTLNKEEIDD